MISDRRTKIVATIGPATSSKVSIEKLIRSGVNALRLNFSHGTHKEHETVISHIRELSEKFAAPVTILQDLQGPKIRTGMIENGQMKLKEGSAVEVSSKFKIGKANKISSDFSKIYDVCSVGDRILLDDGIIELRVTSKKNKILYSKVVYGGVLTNRKGMNLPDSKINQSALTKKDILDLKFGLSCKVDYVALSFVKNYHDIQTLKNIIKKSNSPETRVIAKIERLGAINGLDEIAMHSDAIMVARGDLSVEVGQSQLPSIQKKIITKCNYFGKPVITATQMLESMIDKPRPTRAEVTDIANAVLDGTDAVMLSAETAVGKYPDKCIQTMNEIILDVEKSMFKNYSFIDHKQEERTVAYAVAESACLMALKVDAKLIVSLTNTGTTSRLISSYRPYARILAATHIKETLNKLELMWGVQTLFLKPYKRIEEVIESVKDFLINNAVVKHGDNIVITLGFPLLKTGSTNSVQVHNIKTTNKVLPKSKRPLRYK